MPRKPTAFALPTGRSGRTAMESYLKEFQPPPRLLLGAGPCNVHPRVLRAMTASMLGHLDPDFMLAMDDVRGMLRHVFQTENTMTLPISGTGTAGMEAALVNILEPGDTVVAGVNGYFADRMGEVARRCGATVHEVHFPYGTPVDPDAIREEVRRHKQVKAITVIHAETSTGVLTPLRELGKLARESDALLVVDAVTSLGGVELKVDEWEVDVCYGGTQKCLACPPGLAPLTMGDRALAVMDSRSTPVQSFYLDLSMLRRYWQQRAYHHTAPVTMIYALREGLRILMEEGLEQSFLRHHRNATALQSGIEAMGLSMVPSPEYRLPCLTSVRVPEGIEEEAVRRHLMEHHNTEIGAGLGELAGQIWRIGLMGYNSTAANVFHTLSILEEALLAQGFEVPVGVSLATAQKTLRNGDSS
jgi:alanine-glyoxylate transaminase/serine-glyoxylate transaminase/serine-pyruvate transaminase